MDAGHCVPSLQLGAVPSPEGTRSPSLRSQGEADDMRASPLPTSSPPWLLPLTDPAVRHRPCRMPGSVWAPPLPCPWPARPLSGNTARCNPAATWNAAGIHRAPCMKVLSSVPGSQLCCRNGSTSLRGGRDTPSPRCSPLSHLSSAQIQMPGDDLNSGRCSLSSPKYSVRLTCYIHYFRCLHDATGVACGSRTGVAAKCDFRPQGALSSLCGPGQVAQTL